MSGHQVHAWTFNATLTDEQKEEKLDSETHQTSTVYTMQNISDIPRLQSGDLEISDFSQ